MYSIACLLLFEGVWNTVAHGQMNKRLFIHEKKEERNKQLSKATFNHILGLPSALNWFTYFVLWRCKYHGYLPSPSRLPFPHCNIYSFQVSFSELVLEPFFLQWSVQVQSGHKPLLASQYVVVTTPLNSQALSACPTHLTVSNATLCFLFTRRPSTYMCRWTVDLYVCN